MSTRPRPRLTPEEYLAIERGAEQKSEYVNGEMFALSGASFAHTVITMNVAAGLHARLRGKPCTVHSADLKVRVEATGLHAYPDVVVVCGEPRFVDAEGDVVANPVLLVEVLSESTEKWDRGAKFGHYRRLASLAEVLFVSQREARIEQYVRQPDDRWLLSEVLGLEGVLSLPSLGCDLPLSEVYAKVALEPEDGGSVPRDSAG
ncbi:MAG TPA: Uma2 family endonuclease [Thermoanaerobaculia bacterium]|nr:Uma2 family endonuclease [Thermoanaerobaculia bacterium]